MATNKEHTKKSILVIGGPGVGKTHYGGQLLGRVRGQNSVLALRSTPDSIAPLEEVFRCLAQGKCAQHTPTSTYHEVILPLKNRGENEGSKTDFDLIWPDYGGEQIAQFVSNRRFAPDWRERITNATGWIVFLRPDSARLPADFLSRPQGHISQSEKSSKKPLEDEERKLSDTAFFIELLQILLFAYGANLSCPLQKPHLTLILSRWDEINVPEGHLPSEALRTRLPLVAEFIESNWDDAAYSIWGVSALGKALNKDTADDDYMDLGPTKFGYVICPDGSRSPDLTLPLGAALGVSDADFAQGRH